MNRIPRSDLAELNAACAAQPALSAVPFHAWIITALAGLSNRSYRLQSAAHQLDVAIRLSGAGLFVSRTAELHNAAVAAASGLAPQVRYGDAPSGVLITDFIADARTLTKTDAADPSIRARIGEGLGRLHRSGAAFHGNLDPFATLDRYVAAAGDERLGARRRAAEPMRLTLNGLAEAACPAHVDPVPANWLRLTSGNLILIDWEFSAMADPVWDLATVAVEFDLDMEAETALLKAYDGRIDARRLRKLDLYKPLISLTAIAWAKASQASGGAGLESLIERHEAALERNWPKI